MTPKQQLKSLKQTILFPTDFQVWQAKVGEPEGKAIADEAIRVLTRAQAREQRQRLSLSYEAALRVVGSELLNLLHWQGRVRICKEAPPYVVYVYTEAPKCMKSGCSKQRDRASKRYCYDHIKEITSKLV